MPTYKSPGVFVEEIPKFPPSVAPVDTAIPAFLGYTEKATDPVLGDLKLKPKRISSLVQYEQFFGGPQKETKLAVRIEEVTLPAPGKTLGITTTATLVEADRSKHILYYAMQMYFANGGGPCWIVSVGPYKAGGTPLAGAELKAGLPPLSKVDEPTLIVVPEAQGCSLTDFIRPSSTSAMRCRTGSRSWTSTAARCRCRTPRPPSSTPSTPSAVPG
jgi:uncharacterized protein